jgi:hypothetical protein
MSVTPTVIDWTNTDPAAGAGYQNVLWQAEPATDSPRDVSAEVPNTGGVNVQTGGYTIQTSDCGLIVVHNSSSAHTFLLPAAIPFGQWTVYVQNIGTGTLTLSPNGLNLDTSASSITLAQGKGLYISTDGTNYFSARGGSGGGGGGGGNTNALGPIASLPASGTTAGDQYKCSDSLYSFIWSGSVWVPFVYGYECTMPLTSEFSWVNQGSATVDGTYGGIYLYTPAPGSSGSNFRIQATAVPLSAPYTYTAFFSPLAPTGNFCNIGIGFYETLTTKLQTIQVVYNAGPQLTVLNYSAPTGGSGTGVYSANWTFAASQIWFRAENDGTNLIYSVSIDGAHWLEVYSAAVASYFTLGPTDAIFFVDAENTSYPVAMQLWSWLQT